MKKAVGSLILVCAFFCVNLSGNLRAEELRGYEKQKTKQMLNDSEAYHREIDDITKGHKRGLGAMTQEMVQFYTAVAIVETKNCFLKNDPTACEMFWESMKDPAGHVGFMAFMMTAGKTTALTMYLTKGKLPKFVAGNIGMMAGMMVQDVLIEFWKHPLTKELIKLPNDDRYPTLRQKMARANHIKNELWKETFGDAEWREQKKIQGISLLSAVALSSGTQWALGRTAGGIVRLAKNGNKAAKVAFRLGRAISIGGRAVRVLNPIGLTITGIIIFLEWSGVTEKYIAHPMRVNSAVGFRVAKQMQFQDWLPNVGPKKLEEAVKDVNLRWFKERATIMEESLKIYSGYERRLTQMSESYYKVSKYYEWLSTGMDRDTYEANEGTWRDEDYLSDLAWDRKKFAKAYFCGTEARKNIRVYLDWHGIMVPFYNTSAHELGDDFLSENPKEDPSWQIRHVEINPYFVKKYRGLCDEDVKRLNGGEIPFDKWKEVNCPITKEGYYWKFGSFRTSYFVCRVNQNTLRQEILRRGKYDSKNVRKELEDAHFKALVNLTEEYEKFRMAYIWRYERLVQKHLLQDMTGRKFRVRGGRVEYVTRPKVKNHTVNGKYFVNHDGRRTPFYKTVRVEHSVLGGLQAEIDYLSSYTDRTSDEKREVIEEGVTRATEQLKHAREVKKFYERTMKDRVREPNFDLLFSDEDWTQMAAFYQNLILH